MTNNEDLGIETKLAYEATPLGSPYTFTDVPKVLDFPELGTTREFVETTNQDSADRTREYIPGLKDVEEIPFEMIYLANNTAQDALEDMQDEETPRVWRVTLQNTSPDVVKYFRAYVTRHTFDGPVADVRKRRVTLRITGPIVDAIADLP